MAPPILPQLTALTVVRTILSNFRFHASLRLDMEIMGFSATVLLYKNMFLSLYSRHILLTQTKNRPTLKQFQVGFFFNALVQK